MHMTKRMLSRKGNFRHLQNVVNEFISWNILELDMFGDAIRLPLVAIGTSAATGARCIGGAEAMMRCNRRDAGFNMFQHV